jgi:hypothetical protein
MPVDTLVEPTREMEKFFVFNIAERQIFVKRFAVA